MHINSSCAYQKLQIFIADKSFTNQQLAEGTTCLVIEFYQLLNSQVCTWLSA